MKTLSDVGFASQGKTQASLQRVFVAETARERARGLLGRAPLKPGEGMYLSPCRAVHTFGMRYPIDLVYLDRSGRVCKLVEALKPWRFSGSLKARGTLELSAGEIRRLGLATDQEVAWG